MKKWVNNLALDAVLKTVAILAILHIILIIFGTFWGQVRNVLGIDMFWPHWEWGFWNGALGIVLAVILYIIIYYSMAGRENN